MQKKFSRSFEELGAIVAFTDEFFSAEGVDPRLRYIVDLCVEEIFVNMVKYNKETSEDILLEIQPHEHGVQVSLTDYNVERFDPREVEPVNVDAPLKARTPGGLGLYLVLKMVDSIHYEYRDRTSKITFVADGKKADV